MKPHIFQAIACTVHVSSHANSCWPMLPAYFFLNIPNTQNVKKKVNNSIYYSLSASCIYWVERYTYIVSELIPTLSIDC